MMSLIMSIFMKKLCEKWLKYVFSKSNLVTARKKIFKIYFQLLKVISYPILCVACKFIYKITM